MNASWIATVNSWVELWAGGVWRACWQGSAAILLVWGLCRMLPRMSPRVRCWLWRLAYAKLLVALFWTTPIDIPLLRPAPTLAALSAPVPESALPPTSHLPQIPAKEASGPAEAVVSRTSLTPLCVLMLLWLFGGMGVAVGFVREWRSARLRGGTAPLDIAAHAALAADFESLCRRFGVRRPIALLVTGRSERPHVFGVIRPAIVLPADLLAESERPALLAVLAHEIAHVQRQDLLWNGLPALAHTLFFFYPLVWLANREWQIAQEIACDELAVLHSRTEVAEYGRMLVRTVTPHRRSPASGIATLGIVDTPQTLKRRLIAMRLFHPISRRKLVFAGGACAALGIFGIVPWKVVAQGARTNRILFVSNRLDPQRFSIFVMDSDGSHVVRLTHGPLPESEFISAADGKPTLRPAATHRNAMELDPVWSPDGKRIAFTLAVAEKPEQDSQVKMNLYVMYADGSDCKEVTHYPYGREASSPAWSPDGKHIAFTRQSRNPDAPGGINSIVCVTDLKVFWPVGPGMWPTWSHDGNTVLYAEFADAKGLTTDLYEAKFVGAGFGRKKLLEGVLRAALSPDGKRLAYLSNTSAPNGDKTANILVSNADGSQPQQLTRFNEQGPVGLQWSSDGRQIYFTRPNASDPAGAVNYTIYAMDADGSRMQALTKGDAPDYLGSAPGPFLANHWMNRIAAMK
jgi:beta-lactamase regulating signal transducer with metallopeptidase domain